MREISSAAGPTGLVEAIRHLLRPGCLVACCLALPISPVGAQLGTIGAGALITESHTDPVVEVYLGAPPVAGFRAYGIGSWTDESWAPTLITAAERVVLPTPFSSTTLGAGLLWLEFNDYRPYPILESTTVVPLPLLSPFALVVVASTQPFQDFEWSIVMKMAVTLFFER